MDGERRAARRGARARVGLAAAAVITVAGASLVARATRSGPTAAGRPGEIECRIPAGRFVMGSPASEPGSAPPEPEIDVELTRPFAIGAHEVTRGEWEAQGLAAPDVAGDPYVRACTEADCPVSNVTWFAAIEYVNRLSASHAPPLPACYALSRCSGDGAAVTCDVALTTPTVYDCAGYRLPTEAEWEYAARAGTRTAYFAGDARRQASDVACEAQPALASIGWYCANAGGATHPVAEKRANPWGLFDTSGNVSEWVHTPFARYAEGDRQTDPGGALPAGPTRLTRGGNVALSGIAARAADRSGSLPAPTRSVTIGFRVARTLPR